MKRETYSAIIRKSGKPFDPGQRVSVQVDDGSKLLTLTVPGGQFDLGIRDAISLAYALKHGSWLAKSGLGFKI